VIAALMRAIDVTISRRMWRRPFPATPSTGSFNVVILSDIRANTLLLPQRTFVRSDATANAAGRRLRRGAAAS